jgi:hypothetical protein
MSCTLAPPAADDGDRPRPEGSTSPSGTRRAAPSRCSPTRCRHTPGSARACHDTRLTLARVAIGKFISRQASETAAAVGFGWDATPSPPSTYQQLRGAYAESLATGQPLPVSSEHTERTVFLRVEDNIAFRFWHDVHHVRLGLSFTVPDELELATWHLSQAEAAGIAAGSLAYRLLEADHIGQVLLLGVNQTFPLDHEAFTLTCAEQGLAVGLLAKMRRIPGRSDGSQKIVTAESAGNLAGDVPDSGDEAMSRP